MIYRDVATFTKTATAHLHTAQDEARTIKLIIRGSLALIEDTRRTIAYLDRLSMWCLGEPGVQR